MDENKDKDEYYTSNTVAAVLFLKEASAALEDIEPDVSLTLLNVASALLEKYNVDQSKLDEMKQLSNKILNG